jgi:predicted dehydrogenase
VSKKLRVGVFGTWRGAVLARLFSEHEDVEVVAGCDANEKHLRELFSARWPKAAAFTNYDEMLAQDFDILIVATYCPEHAPQAIKALRAGKHVLSECQAFHTPAEGVALVEAVEQTGRGYMMAENFGYLRDCLEIGRLYRSGELGQFVYGEAEYVHSVRHLMVKNADGSYHWRCWMPPFYYGHALAVLLQITDTRPVEVNGQSVGGKIAHNPNPIDFASSLVRVDSGALIRNLLSFSAVREPSSAWYCLYGTEGSAETGRWRNEYLTDVNVYHEGDPTAVYRSYMPVYQNGYEQSSRVSHAGADFYMILEFLEALRHNSKMPIDVYRACDYTLPGIQAYRSSLENGKCFEVPDFRQRAVRDRYRNDHFHCQRDESVRKDQTFIGGYDTYYQKIVARINTPTFPFSVREAKKPTELTD